MRRLNLNNNPIQILPASICNLHLTKFLLNSDDEDEDDEEDKEDDPIPLKGNPYSSKVFMNKRFMRHLESFTKKKYVPKTVREVLLLRDL